MTLVHTIGQVFVYVMMPMSTSIAIPKLELAMFSYVHVESYEKHNITNHSKFCVGGSESAHIVEMML